MKFNTGKSPYAAPGDASSGCSTPPEDKRQRFIKNSQYFTICIYVAVMLVMAAVIFKCIIDSEKTRIWLGQIFTMFSPFIFAALLAYVLNPMVHVFYQGIGRIARHAKINLKHSIHTILAILITYLIVIGFIIWVLIYILPEIARNLADFINYIPNAYRTLLDFLQHMQERFPSLNVEAISQPVSEILPDLVAYLQGFATNMVPALYSISMSIAGWIINVLITVIVSIYMLYDKRRIMRSSWRLIYAFVPEKHIDSCHEILTECNRLFSSFVVGKFIDSLIIGILCFILMTILRLPYTLLISIIVGVTNMIPYFGPFIGAIPGVLIILFIAPVKALIFAFMILCLQQFDGLFLGPKILGGSTGIKPLWIIIAITIGGKLAGVIGMFLGVPVVSILTYLGGRYLNFRLSSRNIPDSVIDSALNKMELDD